MPIYKPRPNRQRQSDTRIARFKDCQPCPLSERCAPTGTRDIRISRREDLRQAALEELSDAARARLPQAHPSPHRAAARTDRPPLPRAQEPHLGARKSALQALWTAVLVNLHPIGAALRTEAA